MRPIPLVVAALLPLVVGVAPPEPFNNNCIIGEYNAYNQSLAKDVPWFTVDLDLPAAERWTQIATAYSSQMQNLISLIQRQLDPLVPGLYEKLISWLATWIDNVNQPYRDEIIGIANASGLSLGEAVFFNFFYELNAVCTSIVAEDQQGQLVHARNMDFGLFIGWNTSTHDWILSERLRQDLINIDWVSRNRTVFRSVGFAGYIGIFNGVRPGAFSITMDTRHGSLLQSGLIGLLKWLAHVTPDAQLDTWNVRDTLLQVRSGISSVARQNLGGFRSIRQAVRPMMSFAEMKFSGLLQADSFDAAVDKLSHQQLITSAYYIVGGVKPKQGVIIARDADGPALTTYMKESQPHWYLLETNYDLNKKTFYLDDRRTPGNDCMQRLGQENVSFKGIMNVLSSKTNLNKLTIYSTLMNATSGDVETYVQHCADPCWAW